MTVLLFVYLVIGLLVVLVYLSYGEWPACIAMRSIAGKCNGNMFYFTYVLKSRIDNKLYVGWTTNLDRRLEQHNKGLVEATKYRKPLDLIYYEGCLSERKAIEREKSLKTGFGRSYLKRRL